MKNGLQGSPPTRRSAWAWPPPRRWSSRWAAPSRRGEPGVPDQWLELPFAEAKKRSIERFERRYLTHLLERTRGRIGESAGIAGIAERTLYEKMRRLGLDKEQFRDG